MVPICVNNMPTKTSRKSSISKAKKLKKRSRGSLKFVTIKKESKYGPALYGMRIYYEGRLPQGLDKKTGKIKFGKHILETLNKRFNGKFRLVISKTGNSIEVKKNAKKEEIYWVHVSEDLLRGMNGDSRERTRDIMLDIVRHTFGAVYPKYFQSNVSMPYVPGSLARTLAKAEVKRMSDEDKTAVLNILPDFLASEAIKSVNLLKTAEIDTLRSLEADFRNAIEQGHPESWWQTYIKGKILIIQQGYIRVLDKVNIAVAGTKFPDFLLVTHDGYLDILEIKKPDTNLLKHDKSRDNYHWDIEMSKAIIQVENYIEGVNRIGDQLCIELKDKHGIDLRVLRPRGVILAGNSRSLTLQKEKNDFRLLSLSLKNITVVTYDELLARLSNYIGALEQYVLPTKVKS
jgi:hypothetical protein